MKTRRWGSTFQLSHKLEIGLCWRWWCHFVLFETYCVNCWFMNVERLFWFLRLVDFKLLALLSHVVTQVSHSIVFLTCGLLLFSQYLSTLDNDKRTHIQFMLFLQRCDWLTINRKLKLLLKHCNLNQYGWLPIT